MSHACIKLLDSPSLPSDGGEGWGEEARSYWFPRSSVLSPLVPRRERVMSLMQPCGSAGFRVFRFTFRRFCVSLRPHARDSICSRRGRDLTSPDGCASWLGGQRDRIPLVTVRTPTSVDELFAGQRARSVLRRLFLVRIYPGRKHRY